MIVARNFGDSMEEKTKQKSAATEQFEIIEQKTCIYSKRIYKMIKYEKNLCFLRLKSGCG